MSYMNKIIGKVSITFYIFLLYEGWHLCQYGGVRSHFFQIAVGVVGVVATFILWIFTRKFQKPSEELIEKKELHIEIAVVLIATFFIGGGIVYSAIPYHGALSWKIDEWRHRKEISLEHTNIFESGVEGILSDLNKELKMPEQLYIANEFRVTFDENGKIQSIYTFLYGKNEKGKEKTYLIDYDAKHGDSMTVWTDGYTNGNYESEMCLTPMLEILKKADWIQQVQTWSGSFTEPQTYEILYYGRRGFLSDEGLKYIPGDADGDGVETGNRPMAQIKNGGEIIGFEVSLHIPADESVTPIRYIMEPEYISLEELKQENTEQQIEEARNTERWTVDTNGGMMYFFLDDQNGWRLVIADAAAGSRYYRMEKTTDSGENWSRINDDPFLGEMGVAEGMLFFDENIGIIGLTGASQSASGLYLTRDGGATFEEIAFPMSAVTELPKLAEECGLTIDDYDYCYMPEQEGNALTVIVTTEAGEKDGIEFQSKDNGLTWEYSGVIEE